MNIDEIIEGSKLDADLVKEIESYSPERAMLESVAALKLFPDSFAALREAINSFASAQKKHIAVYDEFLKTFGDSLGAGVTAKLAACRIKAQDLEDDTTFVRELARIGNEKDPRVKMRSCISASNQIDGLIESRESKIAKMKERTQLDGSSEAEIAICLKRSIVLERAVGDLQKRKDALAQIYCEAKKEIVKFLDKCDEEFKPSFVNESTGKVKEAK